MRYFFDDCIVEYSGAQRSGKSTLLVRDIARTKYLFPECNILTNFRLDLPDTTTFSSDNLIQEILRIKRDKLRKIIIGFDELSQVLTGRGYSNKLQTDVSSFLWQMPKREIALFYTSNLGKSVDLIIRLATFWTLLPIYFPGSNRLNDYILYRLIRRDCPPWEDRIATNLVPIQNLFNTREEIE